MIDWLKKSLYRTLLAWIIVPFVLVTGVRLVDIYVTTHARQSEAFDRQLLAFALIVREHATDLDGQELARATVSLLRTTFAGRIEYKATLPSTGYTIGNADLPEPPSEKKPAPGNPRYFDVDHKGVSMRGVALTTEVATEAGRDIMHIAVFRENALLGARVRGEVIRSFFYQVVILVGLIVFLVIGIHLSLRPLQRLRQSIRRRSREDLRAIDHDLPEELRDLVEALNQLFARLKGSIEEQDRFIARASHQLRTPLAELSLATDMALRSAPTPEARQALERVQSGARKASRLASQLLQLARSESQLTVVSTDRAVDLVTVAGDTLRDLVPRALRKGIDLGLESRTEEADVAGNPTLLTEMLVNLVENAIEYCPAKSNVTVQIEKRAADGWWTLAVGDDGPGVPAEQFEAVKRPFVRLDESRGDGCGLGLSIVDEIARRHGGQLELRSSAEGKGLLAIVALPPFESRQQTEGQAPPG
ncbi:MAG: sensor histidine kinase [Hyphomicrobiaceae bacterium]|nr:sensor histidine kinase [Hyphomicrobiaceae bacterium]